MNSLGHTEPEALPKGALKQLATAFDVQIKRKDRKSQTVSRNGTFDTLALAQQWAKATEQEHDAILKKHGGFTAEFETITVKQALDRPLHQQRPPSQWQSCF